MAGVVVLVVVVLVMGTSTQEGSHRRVLASTDKSCERVRVNHRRIKVIGLRERKGIVDEACVQMGLVSGMIRRIGEAGHAVGL